VADRRPPGPTRSAARHGCNSDRGPAAGGGPTVLANDRNGGRLQLNASRHDDDDDDEHPKILTHTDPLPVELSVTDFRWQIAAERSEIAQWSQ